MANEYYVPAPDIYIPGEGTSSTDFIGFSFNGVESSDLGIVRVSASDRYNDILIPNFQDKAAQMPGSDFTLYWESFYSTRSWTVNIAFDELTETQLRRLRQAFDTKNIGKLIFHEKKQISRLNWENSIDKVENLEDNYIYYTAKVQSPPQLNYICFDVREEWTSVGTDVSTLIDSIVYRYTYNNVKYEESGSAIKSKFKNENKNEDNPSEYNNPGCKFYRFVNERIYKGEGTIQFIAYYPFGMRDVGTTREYDKDGDPRNEKQPGIMLGGSSPDGRSKEASSILYNRGDLPTDWRLAIWWYRFNFLEKIELFIGSSLVGEMHFQLNKEASESKEEKDANGLKYIIINSKSNLVEEAYYKNGWNYTGNVYNINLVGGDFFKIPNGSSSFTFKTTYGVDTATATEDEPATEGPKGGDYFYYKHLYL